MKRSELFFSFIQVPIDFLMLILAAMSAFAIRNIPEFLILKPKLYDYPFESYIKVILIIAPFFILIYALEGLYNKRVTKHLWQEMVTVFKATSIALVILIVAIFLKREWFSSRFVILSGWIMVTVYVSLARYFINFLQKWLLRKKGMGVHRVLLIGRNGKMSTINKLIKQDKNLGYRVVEQIGFPHLKTIKKIKEEKGIDEIILCEPSITDDEQEKLVDYCAINNIGFKYIPTSLQTTRYEVNVLNGEPIIDVKHTPLDGWGKILKRIFDIVFSTIAIIITSPLMLIIALAIKIESKGPVVYKNERVGDNGKKFFVYKFRYMKWEQSISHDNPKLKDAMQLEKKLIEKQSVRKGPLYKIKADPRKTRVGRLIEKYSLDELPQFFNVFLGSMSAVGPRPHQEREVEKYMDYHRRLLTIKPGVTGMAQVSGRSDLNFNEEYRLDLYYIENWSLKLDLKLCLKTFGVLLRKRRNS